MLVSNRNGWKTLISTFTVHEEAPEPQNVAAPSVSTDKQEQLKLWHKVTLTASEVGCMLDIHQQRIVFSTLSFVVFDLMVDEVKDYKVTNFKQPGVKNSRASDDKSTITLKESNDRYGGFALYSTIHKRTKDKPIDPRLQMQLRFLLYLSLPRERERKKLSIPVVEII